VENIMDGFSEIKFLTDPNLPGKIRLIFKSDIIKVPNGDTKTRVSDIVYSRGSNPSWSLGCGSSFYHNLDHFLSKN
jgi:hypothetical protein